MPVEKRSMGRDNYSPTDLFPFGEYKGVPFRDVDPDYLLYIYDMPWIEEWPGVFSYINMYFDSILDRQQQNRKPKP